MRRLNLQYIMPRLLVFTALLVISACGNPQQRIIGEWQKVNEGTVLRFHEDGRLEVTSSGVHVTGRYRFVDEDRIRLEYEGLVGGLVSLADAIAGSSTTEFKVSIVWNTMTLTDKNGKQTRYERL